MSDSIDGYKAIGDHRKRLRAKFGVPCPECKKLLPKAHPAILLPQNWCRIHRYKDQRPELTDEEWGAA